MVWRRPMNAPCHLHDHLPYNHPLSPRSQYGKLPPLSRLFVDYAARDLWETDTRRLPAPLSRLRRKARAFAESHLIPASAELDLAPHLPPGQCYSKAWAIGGEA